MGGSIIKPARKHPLDLVWEHPNPRYSQAKFLGDLYASVVLVDEGRWVASPRGDFTLIREFPTWEEGVRYVEAVFALGD